MAWDVEFTDQFELWWNTLDEEEQDAVAAIVGVLEIRGPSLPFPYSSALTTSRHGRMRELRIQHKGKPYRILYAFDPRQVAILLTGGCKVGEDRWYENMVPIADSLYEEHIRELRREDSSNG
jgi:hypothetical protein